MSNWKQLTDAQKSFWREWEKGQAPLAQIMAKLNVSPRRMARWWKSRAFKAIAREWRYSMAQCREMEILRGAGRAIAILTDAIDRDDFKETRRRTCAELTRFAADVDPDPAKTTRPPAPPSLIHPDAAPQAQQLLSELEAMRAKP
jgi:hypothetical protein